DATAGTAIRNPARDLPDPDEAGAHHRVGGERSTGRVECCRAVEPERVGDDQLLVAELRVDLGNVDGTVADTGRSGGGPRRLRLREVTHPERMRFDPVLDA